MGRFDALKDDDDDDSSDDEVEAQHVVDVPSHEDLSMSRADEETVLTAIYGDDFTREIGVWGSSRLNVHVRPPDTDRHQVGSELTLSVQLGKQYPYAVPTIQLRKVTGLSKNEQQELSGFLDNRARECAQTGSVMMCELVQVAEDYLLDHNRDPNMSEWEQMKAREALKQQEEAEAKREQERQLERIMMEQHEKADDLSLNPAMEASGGEVAREMARQVDALAAADRKRRGFDTSQQKEESIDEGESQSDVDFDDVDEPTPLVGSSRYQMDFIELGLLGRGGGGEVVKVRNRLDRRLCKFTQPGRNSSTQEFSTKCSPTT